MTTDVYSVKKCQTPTPCPHPQTDQSLSADISTENPQRTEKATGHVNGALKDTLECCIRCQ